MFSNFYEKNFGRNVKEKATVTSTPTAGSTENTASCPRKTWYIEEPHDLFRKVINEDVVTATCNQKSKARNVQIPNDGHASETKTNQSKMKNLLDNKIAHDLSNSRTAEKYVPNVDHQKVNLDVAQLEPTRPSLPSQVFVHQKIPDKSEPLQNVQKRFQPIPQPHKNKQIATTNKIPELNLITAANQESAPNVHQQLNTLGTSVTNIEANKTLAARKPNPMLNTQIVSQGQRQPEPQNKYEAELKNRIKKMLALNKQYKGTTIEQPAIKADFKRANSNVNQPEFKRHMTDKSHTHKMRSDVINFQTNTLQPSQGYESKPKPKNDNQRERQLLEQRYELDSTTSASNTHYQKANPSIYQSVIKQNAGSNIRKTGFAISELLRDVVEPNQDHTYTTYTQQHKQNEKTKMLSEKTRTITSHQSVFDDHQSKIETMSKLLTSSQKQASWPASESNIHKLATEYVPKLGPNDQEPQILKLGSYIGVESDKSNMECIKPKQRVTKIISSEKTAVEEHNKQIESSLLCQKTAIEEHNKQIESSLLCQKKERNIRELDKLRAVRNPKRKPNINKHQSLKYYETGIVEDNMHKLQFGTKLHETEEQMPLDFSLPKTKEKGLSKTRDIK